MGALNQAYNKLHVCSYDKVQHDTMSDGVVLKVMSKENTYTRAIQGKWLSNKVALANVRDKEVQTAEYALHEGIPHLSLKELDPRINSDKSPRNFSVTMKVLEKQTWAAAYNSEYLGF